MDLARRVVLRPDFPRIKFDRCLGSGRQATEANTLKAAGILGTTSSRIRKDLNLVYSCEKSLIIPNLHWVVNVLCYIIHELSKPEVERSILGWKAMFLSSMSGPWPGLSLFQSVTG